MDRVLPMSEIIGMLEGKLIAWNWLHLTHTCLLSIALEATIR